jgi:acyl dehydratase
MPGHGTTLTQHDFPRDPDARHFEDYATGLSVEYGPIAVDEADIVAFGRQFDPQPFHVDRQQAANGPFGGVIASGWHTASLMMRLLVDHFLPRKAGLASPGVDELRWLAPVRPGDQLSVRIRVTEARRSRSKPDRGVVQTDNQVVNQRGEIVMTVKTMTMMRCRSAATPVAAAASAEK